MSVGESSFPRMRESRDPRIGTAALDPRLREGDGLRFIGEEEEHALRTARLSLRPRTPAGPAEALRHDHLGALEEARHRAGRLLDHRDRRVEPDPLLFPEMGIA